MNYLGFHIQHFALNNNDDRLEICGTKLNVNYGRLYRTRQKLCIFVSDRIIYPNIIQTVLSMGKLKSILMLA